ncbi:AC2 protein [Horsegram yellow mosaic virus]|uniref:Transcriptional activator protein n=1 Tax=Horsegram yellow mosaic virus TaxID=263793 RepID=Q701P9_9GEMI|nr:AC2 protein [Horsegram yellow mosaic virus]UVN12654.1 transcription activator protein [Horsegram yellow mosaic virus]UVN12660.1 transcription activator protein [Horsegram yellow mosaic virus]CAF29512.1 AC2 protein [Horsegram yellow mosaic virus]
MRNSTPSKNHSSPPSIKAQHRVAKKRAIRRSRIDLTCGCSYYIHINCRNYGFSHRGQHHCSSTQEWRLYLGGAKSPLFQDPSTSSNGSRVPNDRDPNPPNVQPRTEESIADAQMLPRPEAVPLYDDDFWDDIINF